MLLQYGRQDGKPRQLHLCSDARCRQYQMIPQSYAIQPPATMHFQGKTRQLSPQDSSRHSTLCSEISFSWQSRRAPIMQRTNKQPSRGASMMLGSVPSLQCILLAALPFFTDRSYPLPCKAISISSSSYHCMGYYIAANAHFPSSSCTARQVGSVCQMSGSDGTS